jgi:hypothetical protein
MATAGDFLKTSIFNTFLKGFLILLSVSTIAAGIHPTSGIKSGTTVPIPPSLKSIASIAPGWTGTVIGVSDQSFSGWDVAIGDADNDGKNEILTGGCPDSKLDMYKYTDGKWSARTLGVNFADFFPALTKNIRIADLDSDGKNEIVLGTGSDGVDDAKIHVLKMEGGTITKHIQNRTGNMGSTYTHNFGIYDTDGDGLKEILSSYCGSGENYRWDIDSGLTTILKTKIYQNSGSGEDAMIVDIDGDGKPEYIEADSYRKEAAFVRIFKFDASGNLITPPWLTINGFAGHPAFDVSFTSGDINNDGRQELIVQWKRYDDVSRQTIIAYRISGGIATTVCTIADEDPDLDSGFSENNCYWTDADNDGTKELYISTRGEQLVKNGSGYARILRFKIDSLNPTLIQKDIILDFNAGIAESCWINIGDADNDGMNEIVVATGKGSRTIRGTSYVAILKKTDPKVAGGKQ